MKLNPDCIRDILLTVEEKTAYMKRLTILSDTSTTIPRLQKYSQDELNYHIQQCINFNYIIANSGLGGAFKIDDLTFSGHNFLADIRKDTNWNKTKEIAGNIGSYSLDILANIAKNVVTALVLDNFK
jgi:hypothetical protein